VLTTLRLAYRNTSRQRRRTLLLAGAIGFGFLIITLLNATTAGVEDSIRINFASLLGGHLYVTGEEILESGRTVSRVEHTEAISRAVEELSYAVTNISRRSNVQADAIFGAKSTTQFIEGVDFTQESDIFQAMIPVEGTPEDITNEPLGIILPAETAETIQAVPGETVILRLSTVTGQSSVGEVRLVATVDEGETMGISRAYMHLSTVNELIGLEENNFQSFTIYLEDARLMNRAARELTDLLSQELNVVDRSETQGGQLGGFGFGMQDEEETWEGVRYRVTTLEDVLGQVIAILDTVDQVALAVFVVLLLVTMVGITNTYRMVVLERRNEIGTMRALGMHRKQIRNLFLSEASMTSLVGVVGGFALAGLLMLVLGAISLDNPAIEFITVNNRLQFIVTPGAAIRNVLIVVAVSAAAAYFPARHGARMRPVDALRATV
jgi:putative ABC transport system permease protein